MPSLRRAVFLDRDGIINLEIFRAGAWRPPSALSELRFAPGVDDCLAHLKRLGFLLVIVTNQPDVARGQQTVARVEEMHAVLRSRMPIDDIYVCYHDDPDDCACRKPRPGMLLKAAEDHGLDLRESFLIGDRWRDVEAGRRVACRTVLVRNESSRDQREACPTFETNSLGSAVHWIAAHSQGSASLV